MIEVQDVLCFVGPSCNEIIIKTSAGARHTKQIRY